MSTSYQAVGWNRQKKIYDAILAGGCILYLLMFIGIDLWLQPDVTFETILIRSTSTLALLLLHIILSIGPLTRLDNRFLPLLYNRRHLGVTMFVIAAVHSVFSILQFHSLGNKNPLVSLFVSNTHFGSIPDAPFQALGFVALLILLLMAATSHDFWLRNLSARTWKTLHMCVYAAYSFIILHVLLGAIQYETAPVFIVILGIGMATLIALHLAAGIKEVRDDRLRYKLAADGFAEVCAIDTFEEGRAKQFCVEDERIAIYLHQGNLFAVHNVCKHQMGPIGDGRIIDGCITCPWHGYQYLPHNGRSPAPFKEKLATYDVRVEQGKAWVNPTPFAEGTERPGTPIDKLTSSKHSTR